MTLGTSPHPLGAALEQGAGAEPCVRATLANATQRCSRWVSETALRLSGRRAPMLRALAGIYLVALVGMLVSAWDVRGWVGEVSSVGQVHLAFLMLAGAGMAVAGLRADKLFSPPKSSEPAPMHGGLTGLGDLLAQMSHELRTPLNAVIGFSEVMRHELHGPLNARYQEYAIHICESGDRMLKSSQDALAVAEAMTVLLAKTPHLPRERLAAGTLLGDAWSNVRGGTGLDVIAGASCEFKCERRATTQALEHLLREAANRAREGVEVTGSQSGGERSIKIRARGAGVSNSASSGASGFPMPHTGGLNLLLARLLLEAQGARLDVGADTDGAWLAAVTFAAPPTS